MIAAFLQPYPARGYAAPLLWIFYRLLSTFPENMVFLASQAYRSAPEVWQAQGRWEATPAAQARLGYRLPDADRLEHVPLLAIDEAVFETLERDEHGNADCFRGDGQRRNRQGVGGDPAAGLHPGFIEQPGAGVA